MDHICTASACDNTRPAHQWICRTCVRRLERDLASAPALWRELEVTLTRQDAVGAGGPRGFETSLAFKPNASDARFVLANTIGTWARLLAEATGVSVPERPARWLLVHVQSLAMHEAVGEAVGDINSAVALAYRAIDRMPELVLAGICDAILEVGDPTAERPADREDILCSAPLYARPGDLRARCAECGAEREVIERRDAMVENAAEYLVTATIALGWVRMLMGKTIPDGTWRSWCSRGRVLAHGTNHLGQATYRFGDVRDLALGWVTKTGKAA